MTHSPRTPRLGGFTLIELLVVIAIIAILAAILFPVFAQAKTAAKKASIVSGQKQINLGIQLYINDYDDVLPRQDDCVAGSSLNAALNTNPFNPTGVGCNAAPFFYRTNHFSWQKWIMPYVKSVDFFIHPGFGRTDTVTSSCPGGQWSGCGQITGGYYLNLSLTGALNTYLGTPSRTNQLRDSFRGGTITGLPRPSETMLLMEGNNPNIAFVPTFAGPTTGISSINYPSAMREIWEMEFGLRAPAASCTGFNSWNRRSFGEGTTIGFADGSVKWFPIRRFLGATPTIAEYATPSSSVQACGFTGGTSHGTPGVPVGITNNIQYPLWALGD